MLSEMARLMFLRFKSNAQNITHAQRVMRKSNCNVSATPRFTYWPLSRSLTLRTSFLSSSAVHV